MSPEILYHNQIVLFWSVVAVRSSALDSSPGVVRMWVQIGACLLEQDT